MERGESSAMTVSFVSLLRAGRSVGALCALGSWSLTLSFAQGTTPNDDAAVLERLQRFDRETILEVGRTGDQAGTEPCQLREFEWNQINPVQ